MNKIIPYSNFEKFSFRVPVLPFNFNDKDFIHSAIFNEAIFLASNELWTESFGNKKEIDTRIWFSLLKYFSRMKSRCTPFGLFAGVGMGTIGGISEIILNGFESFKSNTRLDMNYLCMLSEYLNSIEIIRDQLLFFPNSSLYKLWKRYRYVEFKTQNGIRKHFLSEIEFNEIIETVLTLSEKGILRIKLIKNLINLGFEELEATEFINELIDSQIIVSDLDIQLTSDDMLMSMIDKLDTLKNKTSHLMVLKLIKEKLSLLDSMKLGTRNEIYSGIEEEIKKLNINYSKKYLFQSDTFVQPMQNKSSLSIADVNSIKEGIAVLNKLFSPIEDKEEILLLKQFTEKFYARYEEEEIPLVEALDSDIGIGFGDWFSGSIDNNNSLIEGIFQIGKNQQKNEYELNKKTEALLFQKYIECINEDKYELILTDNDIDSFSEEWKDLPPTLSAIIEVINVGDFNRPSFINLLGLGTSSAANYLGRFCYLSDSLNSHVKEIIEKESSLVESNNTLIAEIIHLPESRIGNVLFRPGHRLYEIPYLARPSVEQEKTISINDLMISVPFGKYIQLRSIKHNKIVIPRLTSAHNFTQKALPIYHFLGLLQFQGLRATFLFNWGTTLDKKKFLPRVIYKNIVLSPAQWTISDNDLTNMPRVTDSKFMDWALEFKKSRGIANKVLLPNKDNKLLIDFDDPELVRLLFHFSKGKGFVLEESCFTDSTYVNSLVKNNDGTFYTNQVIVSFYKEIL